MNELINEIENNVMKAIQPSAAPRRRLALPRRSVLLIAVLTILLASGTAAALNIDPIQRLFQVGPEDLRPAHRGAQQIDISDSDETGLRWELSSYVSRGNTLAQATAADGQRYELPNVGAGSATLIAQDLQRTGMGSLTGATAVADDGTHQFVGGLVDSNVTSVDLLLSDEPSRTATLGDKTIVVPVDKRPSNRLTDEGRRIYAQLPDEIRVRPFAVAVGPATDPNQTWSEATLKLTQADGRISRIPLRKLCRADSCAGRGAIPVDR